jgi:hypothetical protein
LSARIVKVEENSRIAIIATAILTPIFRFVFSIFFTHLRAYICDEPKAEKDSALTHNQLRLIGLVYKICYRSHTGSTTRKNANVMTRRAKQKMFT